MTRIVALDTASEYGSIALVEDGTVVEEVLLHSPEGFGHVLFPALDRLMKRHLWRHETVTGYAAGSGPGSFTGVRIALAAVKGLAEAAGAKAAGVSNLMAMASFGSAHVRAPFCDARRGEIYGALYDESLHALSPEVVARLQVWRDALPAGAELLTSSPEVFGIPATVTPRALAGAIGRLAAARLTDPVALDANYVRRPDAELNWKDIS
ncbi:MAG: tRNA (adenosine(37)-N6)-threonylcarbamoyltransferase complex dimerization subunit type 1 TsaB [Candidatus Solibacter usitatus]|nr:tRNA (adenosine(37)-N6)-threonylcarbamoyltransferase complex dimerization subunit type 1 TsaB [Candidatus Solibacter usitatus]